MLKTAKNLIDGMANELRVAVGMCAVMAGDDFFLACVRRVMGKMGLMSPSMQLGEIS
jgi:hypothetical protein